MRKLTTLLAAAAVVAVGLSTVPANAYEGWSPYGSENGGWHQRSREQAWREMEWRRHEWFRHHWHASYYSPRGY